MYSWWWCMCICQVGSRHIKDKEREGIMWKKFWYPPLSRVKYWHFWQKMAVHILRVKNPMHGFFTEKIKPQKVQRIRTQICGNHWLHAIPEQAAHPSSGLKSPSGSPRKAFGARPTEDVRRLAKWLQITHDCPFDEQQSEPDRKLRSDFNDMEIAAHNIALPCPCRSLGLAEWEAFAGSQSVIISVCVLRKGALRLHRAQRRDATQGLHKWGAHSRTPWAKFYRAGIDTLPGVRIKISYESGPHKDSYAVGQHSHLVTSHQWYSQEKIQRDTKALMNWHQSSKWKMYWFWQYHIPIMEDIPPTRNRILDEIENEGRCVNTSNIQLYLFITHSAWC